MQNNGTPEDFKSKVTKLATFSYKKVIFRQGKWGMVATFSFDGCASQSAITEDCFTDEDMMESVMYSLNNSSSIMVERMTIARGKDFRKYFKIIN